ncbi:MAG: hypothetical protein LBJ00_11480, partial [Planctomycetaceae bacterium]|nr:hypothetical protein [Planctomycetaceae bacterium]
LAVQNAYWAIGSHNYRPYPRYFKGRIFYAAVYNSALANFAELDTDSDNNGYIGQITINPENARYEDGLKLTNPKPITYIDSTKTAGASIPDDYTRVPLRVMYLTDDSNAEFCFTSSNGVKVIKSDGTDAETTLTDISSLDISTVSMATGKEGTFVDNYYAVATARTEPETTLDVSLQIKRNGTTTSDTVKFLWQEAPTISSPQGQKYEWIIPSGWKIETDGITTIMPVTGAVAPKSEGSSHSANNGCTFSVNTYESGFKLTLKYSFTRNGVNGYLQPDRNGDEKIDSSDRRKLSFVGNSGIKLGSFRGTGDGVKEVAIFDTQTMVDRISVTDGGVTFTGIEAFKHRPPTALDTQTYTGVPNNDNSKVKFDTEFISQVGDEEQLAQLLNGIRYNGNLSSFYDYTSATGSGWQKLYNTLENNYNRWQGTADKELEIYWKPSEVGQTQGTLEVYAKINGQWLKYYDETGVEISNGGSLDGHIYIQTHWGSGVKFKVISIGPWAPPPSPPTT